jgi:5,5'-dehydrodivanillate O-demethylase
MIRKRFFEDIDAVKAGADPKSTIRDPERARIVELPFFHKREMIEGIELEEYGKYPLLKNRLAGFRHHFGQPIEVRKSFEQATGVGNVSF